jgi:hypothetical protein
MLLFLEYVLIQNSRGIGIPGISWSGFAIVLDQYT